MMTEPRLSGVDEETDRLHRAIRGIRLVAFDFDGVFTDNHVYVAEDGTEMVRCSRADGIGLQKLRSLGIELVLISTETNCVVASRARKLKLRCFHGIEDKRVTLDAIVAELGIALDQVAFVGNDVNDLCCLTAVGLPIVVQDAHPDVLPYSRYRTSAVGGHGAVREVCDLFAAVLTAPGPETLGAARRL
jgi:3-deoxy-D-manno-octulosonate 8-phosphate phosphatase (KDO 8-P phosphatase)